MIREYNVIEYGADPTLATPSDVAFRRVADLAIAGDIIRIPSGRYRLLQTWGPFAPGVAILGTVGSGIDVSSSWVQFDGEGNGIQLIREANANSRIGNVLRDVTIYSASPGAGAAVAMTGGGAFEVSGVFVDGSWAHGIKVDGSNQVTIERCYLKHRGFSGIWTTRGASGGDGWTDVDSSNVISVRDVSCNGPTFGVWAEGGASQLYERVSCNLSEGGALARIGAVTSVTFRNGYSEGVGDAHYLFEDAVSSPCFNVAIDDHFASGLCPAIKLTNVSAYNARVSGGTWNTLPIVGASQFVGSHISVGNAYNGPGRFYDVETAAEIVHSANIEASFVPGDRARAGSSVRPLSLGHERLTTFAKPHHSVYLGDALLEREWFRSGVRRDREVHLSSPGTGLSGSGVIEVTERGTTSDGAVRLGAVEIPGISGASVRATVSASRAGNVAIGGAWELAARVHRAGETAVMTSGGVVHSEADASFTAPSIEVEGAFVYVRCPGDTVSNWTAHLECVVSQP